MRRYGEASLVFLERKTRSGDRVAKRRSDISIQEIQTLARGVADAEWSGSWFHRRLLARGLLPASLIRYERMAYVGASPESPLRLTLDRRAEGLLTGAWELTPTDGWRPLIDGKVILELKFRHALPAPFKRLVESLKLTPGSVSKYRLCRDAFQDA